MEKSIVANEISSLILAREMSDGDESHEIFDRFAARCVLGNGSAHLKLWSDGFVSNTNVLCVRFNSSAISDRARDISLYKKNVV